LFHRLTKTKTKTESIIMKLLSTSNAKTSKGEKIGYLTGVLYLSPAREAGGRNLCPHASQGCLSSCLYTAGRGFFDNVKNARLAKTKLFLQSPKAFVELLALDIEALAKKAAKLGLIPAVRLNGTSDIAWEVLGGELGINLMERYPHIQFYDYTKNPARAVKYATGKLPANYFLAFSRSECNEKGVAEVMQSGGTIAAVFSTKKGLELPKTWGGRTVVDGDEHDAIFEHGAGVVIGLRAKGQAKKDTSGFVIHA
jgi:hypothetical protein